MDRAGVATGVGELLGKVCELRYRSMRASLQALGLYKGQPAVLRALWAQDGMTQAALADDLQRCPATITKMVQRMEKAGFVQRKGDPSDQRLSRVYLTGAGRRIQAAVEETWSGFEERAMAGFSADERRILGEMLVRVCRNLAPAP